MSKWNTENYLKDLFSLNYDYDKATSLLYFYFFLNLTLTKCGKDMLIVLEKHQMI